MSLLTNAIKIHEDVKGLKISPNISKYERIERAMAPVMAGYIAGVSGLIIGHPLDSLKVLIQTGNIIPGQLSRETGAAAATSASTSVTAGTSFISNPHSISPLVPGVRNTSTLTISPQTGSISGRSKRSLMSLYSGIGGPLLTVGAIQSINFAIYDSLRRIMYNYDQNNSNTSHGINEYLYNDSLVHVAVAASASGAVISFLTSPLVVIKTKQQIMMWNMKKAARDTLRRQGGIRNFYAGFGAHFFCDTLGRGLYFTSYEYLKRQIVQNRQDETQRHVSEITTPERMLCAATAGMLCWTLIFPADVIRSKIYAESSLLSNTASATSSLQMMQRIWRKGGARPFYRGIAITVARAGPVAAVVLPVYDAALEWLTQQ